ncbi:hypothetical protein [Campylobacter fetus]|uniref:hypothetical protein n=1 Tax=Campylobacter fetus TaxID=196 RepID=UPI000FCB1ED6|nr:hypothetical protein [Campylobacter fetus]RUT51169.1 hypothetical protein BWK67_01215 [Campylobacter fetus]RUT51896.1 hypothetical protein BWK51_01215 [Campylobacter fetus]
MKENFLTFYIGQDEHYIQLEEMKQISQSIQNISNELKFHFLNDKNIDVLIYPSKEGSYKILISFATIILSISHWLNESEAGQAFVKGLTGHETPYYYQKAGEFIRDMVKGVLSKEESELSKYNNGYTDDKFYLDKCISEKSNLYKVLYRNKNIKFLSFEPDYINPIEKKNFINHVLNKDILRPLEPKFEFMELSIIKSVNTNTKAKWKFKNINSSLKFNARICDEFFIERFLLGYYPLKQEEKDDILLALVKIDKQMKNGEESNKEFFIMEVYKFNEDIVKKLPNDLDKHMVIKYDVNKNSLL